MPANDRAGGRDLGPDDFEPIKAAVMETPRGRWFLDEFARRIRGAESATMLDSMKRIEQAVIANHDALMQRLAQALAREPGQAAPAASSPQADLAPKHMKFFKQDEEIFEPAPQAKIAAVPEPPRPEAKTEAKPEAPKGARVVIRRTEQASVEIGAPAAAPALSESAPAAQPATAGTQSEAQPKRRIVIIRHKPGEDIDVPLQNDVAKAS